MAEVLRLANSGQTVLLDLLSGALRLKAGTWTTRSANVTGQYRFSNFGAQWQFDHYGPVSETLDLVANQVGAGAIRATLGDMTDFLEQARRWHGGGLADSSVWLEWNSDGEPVKRALIYDGAVQLLASGRLNPMLTDGSAIARLALTRHALWENVAASSLSTIGISALGGKYEFTGVAGNAPARISLLQVDGNTGAETYPLTEIWAGFREKNQGSSNFNPVWECEDGTNATDAADGADATASDGNKVRVTFATVTTLAKRMSISVTQAAAGYGHTDYVHFQGRYLVLLRCKTTAGTIGVQMRSGYDGEIQGELAIVENTSWLLKPLGEVSIPSHWGSQFSSAGFIKSVTIELWAERITALGTENLDLDCLVLIPAGAMVSLSNTALLGATHVMAVLATRENDETVGYEFNSAATAAGAIDYSPTEWSLPVGDGVLVVAAQATAAHELAVTMDVAINYVPRWLLFRE